MKRLLGLWLGAGLVHGCGLPEEAPPTAQEPMGAVQRSVQTPVRLSAGNDHALMLHADGTVWAVGENSNGKLGNGLMSGFTGTPVRVQGLSGTTSVSAGGFHSLALRSDGSVWAWGDNYDSQLGDGTNTSRAVPVQVQGLSDAVAVAAGWTHSLAVRSNGTVWAWGDNDDGQLGDGTTTTRSSPVQVKGLTSVVSVSSTRSFALAVRSNGTVWAWGDNYDGQLGDGTTTDRPTAAQVPGLSGVIAVATGYNHALALRSDGTVWSWGDNYCDKLGSGTRTNETTPAQVSGLSGVVAVAAGSYFSVAVRSDGSVWTWGCSTGGQLGNGVHGEWSTSRAAPMQVSGLSGITAVSAGSDFMLAGRSDGTAWAWGDNAYGQLGLGYERNPTARTSVLGLSTAKAAAAGNSHSLALLQDGTVWGWGRNQFGQLGDGTGVNRSTPVKVMSQAVAVAAGTDASLVLRSDGTVWSWGRNDDGLLGDGTTTPRSTPVQVSGLSGVKAVTMTTRTSFWPGHALAVRSDGTVWAWGENISTELGQGEPTGGPTGWYYAPVQVKGMSGAVAVAAGDGYSLAVRSDGTVWSWGRNDVGQLGDDTTTQRSLPVQVKGLSGAVAVAAEAGHSMALRSNGTVWVWGYNSFYGELWDGTTTDRTTPVQLQGVTDGVKLAVGSSFVLVTRSNGTVLSWGLNDDGQVGNAKPWIVTVPTPSKL